MLDKRTRISTKGWSLDSLISSSANFYPVDRIPASSSKLSQLMKDHERKGLPLVIEGFHKHENWPTEMFTIEGFKECSESIDISVRNVHTWTDKVIKLSDFVLQSRRVGPFAGEGETERLYGKDAECPRVWDKWLQEGNVLPLSVLSHGKEDEFRFRPLSSRIETLMCYLGIGDTYTPCHKDLCASSGHNLMCYTENNGSSFWFMTEGSSAPEASAYFHGFGEELDHENHVIKLEQLRSAPFKVYILEQRLGDLVLVPPRSCHQVVNYGGITIKTSWSRMTLKGLSMAYHHELPIYRRVGRPETYRIKSTIYYALTSRIQQLGDQLSPQLAGSSSGPSFPQDLVNAINLSTHSHTLVTPNSELDSLAKDLMELLHLYDLVLEEEKPSAELKIHRQSESSFNDDNRIVCDFCECDIFQSFFECGQCTISSSSYIVCPGCYSEGRSCICEIMQPMQCRRFKTLIDTRNKAADVLEKYLEKTERSDIDLNDRHERSAPQLFRAACLVLQARKDRKTTRKCSRLASSDSHEVPFAWGLHCPPCHRSACFTHILKLHKMHSVEAILLFYSDQTRMQYHRQHQLSSARYRDNLPDVDNSQREGSPIDGLRLLAHIASQYSHCLPSNMKSLQLGWYDPLPEEKDPSYSNGAKDAPNNEPKLTITIPPLNKGSSATQFRNGRKQVFVEVPPAPHISRKRRRISEHETKSAEGVPPSSGPRMPSSFTPRAPKTPSPLQSRITKQPSDSSTGFQHGDVLASPQLTRSISLPVVAGTPRSPQQMKRKQHESLSSQTYLEAQAAKKSVVHGLHFKKKPCPTPDNDSFAMTLTPNLPDGNPINPLPPPSPPQDECFHHPAAQFVPPQEELTHSALGISELMDTIAMPPDPQ